MSDEIMPKEVLRRFAFGLAIIMLGLWGVGLILFPDMIAGLFSEEPVNHALAGMFGAALLGLAFISLADMTEIVSGPRALGIAMVIIVAESAYLMLGSGAMLVTPATAISVVTAAAVAFFLLI